MSAVHSIIGISAEILALRALIKTVGPSDATALILGDSGTGKELVANALHDCSIRNKGPFIPVNCGAIPKDLLESELFGHKRGSFTGAISDRKGRFQLADKGTLFLDEIGDMSMDLQVKLLRVLQERTVDPVGSLGSIPIDVRVVAATHQNIEALVDEGRFRKDLYYRLNIMPIEVSPLADRVEDIPLLIEHFAKQQTKAFQKPISISPASMKVLLAYDWPGNVRELSNLVNRYTALYAQQEVDLRQVPSSMVPIGMRAILNQTASDAVVVTEQQPQWKDLMGQDFKLHSVGSSYGNEGDLEVERLITLAQGGEDFPNEGVMLKQHLLEMEKRLIQQALNKAAGNVSQTARLLNLQRTTLIEKINKYGLSKSA